ncbi:hypothetical protein SBOR_5973 [Sclerotinia borealis F-4128]|uniref:Uncharacterized protein n=1 Tax=Sclerotinia borealis (strain F-4128) TaxID=1432307 RepID=W9CCW4_SCLBF|nr:hypothetical protein SBOR_5973 [Sclerotinia borealis F-4128]
MYAVQSFRDATIEETVRASEVICTIYTTSVYEYPYLTRSETSGSRSGLDPTSSGSRAGKKIKLRRQKGVTMVSNNPVVTIGNGRDNGNLYVVHVQ